MAGGVPALHPERRHQLSRVPGKQNWIEKTPSGGYSLPLYINSVATALKREYPHWPISRVIATAVNWAKKVCATGRTFDGRVKVSPAVRAAACKAVSTWEAKKAEARTTSMNDNDFELLLELAQVKISDKPWSQFKESDYTLEQWKRACLVKPSSPSDRKEDYKYPVREPDGTLNRNAVHAAASRLSSGNLTPEQRASLKRKLRGLYRLLGEEPPDSLKMSVAEEEGEGGCTCCGGEDAKRIMEEAYEASASYRLPLLVELAELKQVGKGLYEKEVLRTGRINYKGRVVEFTPEDLRRTVENFKARAVDYVPFQFVTDDNAHSDDPRLYGGEVVDLKLADGGRSLKAVVRLTPEAERIVKHNPRFGVSVKYHPNYVRETDGRTFGPTLLHLAGTHRPRLTDLAPWEAVAASVDDELTVDLSDAEFVLASSEEEKDVKEQKKEELTLSAEELNRRIASAVSEAVERERQRAKELESKVHELAEGRFKDHVSALKEKYAAAGVKPAILDVAEQLMLSFREEPGEITLSEGDGGEVKLNRIEALARILDNCKGQVDLSAEQGSDEEPADLSQVDERAVESLVKLIRG